jgi:O-antigen/teichoic acid export membrane protein
MESLKTKTATGLLWSFLDSFGVYLVRFGFSVAIARTLAPEDYGLMGMIVIFISLGQMIMQGGFSMALIQKKESTDTDHSTAFWFNLCTALTVYLILFFSAGSIAAFFEKPLLVSITRVAAVGIVINSLCSVQVAILSREMDFRRQTSINLVSSLVSGITGLVLAMAGFNVWALVFQTLAGNVIYLAGLWLTSSWRPRLVFNMDSFRSLFGFGYKILLQGLTDVIFTKSYFPLIGKLYSAPQLGYYTNASRFYDIFIRQTTNSVTRVIFPAFSSVQEDHDRFNRNYIRSFNMLSALMFPGALILIVASKPFVSLALTDKWLPAVPFMQLFFAEGFFFPLMMFNQNIILSMGRSGLSLRIDIARKILIMLSILILFRAGIGALIAGQVTATAALFIFSTAAVVRFRKINAREIIFPLMKLSALILLCFLLNNLVIDRFDFNNWILLVLKITLIPSLFILTGMLLSLASFRDIRDFMADQWIHKIRK